MTRKRLWLWISLFVIGVLLIGGLATGWNVVLVKDYQRLAEQAREFRFPRFAEPTLPWIEIVLGTAGFCATLAALALFFIRLLQEMRLNQLQSEFLASVTHALKTPIATLELSGGLLRDDSLSVEERARLWKAFDQELTRLKQEVETLLEATRWQGAPKHMNWRRIDLIAWTEAVVRRWAEILPAPHSIALEAPAEPMPILTDPEILRLVLDNLIENARKFARGPAKITVRVERDEAEWKLEVRDEGWGFDPRDAKKIFQRFWRAKSGAPYSIPGTGLGLYLARNASRAVGSQLRGASDGVGRGSSFTLSGKVATPEAERQLELGAKPRGTAR